jgi:hypothetical protein
VQWSQAFLIGGIPFQRFIVLFAPSIKSNRDNLFLLIIASTTDANNGGTGPIVFFIAGIDSHAHFWFDIYKESFENRIV